jgi:predicted dienelactone hydrolase
VLAAAGGEPDLRRVVTHCRDYSHAFECGLTAHGERSTAPVVWTHDPRLKAIVVAAPALGYTFGREDLAKVRAPVQLWRAENDTVLPHPFYAEAVRLALPTPPEFHLAEGADHFDFLRPCTAEIAKAAPQICVSPVGFDRSAFHLEFNRDVVAFFRRTLPPPS